MYNFVLKLLKSIHLTTPVYKYDTNNNSSKKELKDLKEFNCLNKTGNYVFKNKII